MGVAETDHLRGTRPAHAPTHINVGGYMRGKGKSDASGGVEWGGVSCGAPVACIYSLWCPVNRDHCPPLQRP